MAQDRQIKNPAKSTYGIDEPLPTRIAIGWALGGLGSSLVISFQGLLFMRFATDYLAVSAVTAGTLLAVGRIFDAITDPVMGAVSDRTKTRWGRRRPFVLAGSMLCAIALIALYNVPAFPAPTATVTYLFGALVFFSAAYTVFRIPHLAMPAEMTNNVHSRSLMMVFKVYATLLGANILAQSAGPALLDYFGSDKAAHGMTALVLAPIIFLSGLVTFISTRNARYTENSTSLSISLREQIKTAVSNRPYVSLLSMKVLYFFGTAVFGASFPYFTKFILERGDSWIGLFFLFNAVGLAVSLPFWLWLIRRRGKRFALIGALAVNMLAKLSLLLSGPSEALVVFALRAFVIGVSLAAVQLAIQAMLPDTIQHDYNRTGLRREGIFAAFFTTVEKGTGALGAAFLGFLLGATGYLASRDGVAAVQPESALTAISLAVSVVPAIAVLASTAAIWTYRVPDVEHFK